ncbi:hypothetical protein [Adhaeribacter terreus]|uniref:YD repeat-containing protein n=1 Tax=Adhaeribacter terreus TaxID=529703 RepID=A0ABW0EE36_9BACT
MNKFYGIISAVLGCMLLLSCDKEREPKVDPKLGIYLPVGSTSRDSYYNEITDSTRHVYDNSGKLVQFIRSDGTSPGYPIDLVYDNLGRVFKIMTAQRVLEQREYNVQGQLYKIHLYYNPDDVNFKSGEEIFGYDAAGKLIKIHSIRFDNRFGNPPYHTLNTFTYYAAGLIAIDSSFIAAESTGNGKPWYGGKIEYEYDAKKGVNEFGLSRDWRTGYVYLFSPLKHNITSIKETKNNGSVLQVTYQYEYNAHDYPIKISAFSDGRLGQTTRITYQYF